MRRAAGALLIGLLVPAAFAAAPASARRVRPSCTISVTASAHDSSLEAPGYDASPRRLEKLVALTRERLAAAARRLCLGGVLSSADLARFGRVVVQNGEGATEPVIYEDPLLGPDFLIFQYAFQNGDPPDAKAFEQALRCWKRPQSPGCYED